MKLPAKAPERVVYLTLTTWTESSCVAWAEHWYGRLHQRLPKQCDSTCDVTHKLTRKEARHLNEGDPTAPPYKTGDESGRFFDRQSVIDAALAQWKEHWPDADILILGEQSCLDPQEVLAGPEPLKSDINAIVEWCHSTGYYDAMQLNDEHKALRRDWLLLWEGPKREKQATKNLRHKR